MDILSGSWILARDFFERGGGVLLALGLIILAMWTLILSRWLYLRSEFRADIAPVLAPWAHWANKDSAFAGQLKSQSLNSVNFRLHDGIPLIRTLAAICPLLGLLGTVVGMITVFSMMGVVGSGSPRVVASGVSTAMVTTMAGMVGALSGIFPAAMLARRARFHVHNLQTAEGGLAEFEVSGEKSRHMRFKRYLIAPAGALLITFTLVFSMEYMILIGRAALAERDDRFSVDFVRIERDETVARKQKPEKPPQPERQPEMPQQQTSSFESAIRLPAVTPQFTMDSNPGTSFGGTGGGATDGEYLPVVMVAPIYPARAAVRGVEGYVLLEFTVTASGDTKDIVIIESTSNLFNVAAIESAQKYKYRPRIIDGVPVDVAGVRTRIIFSLAE